jgi:hypothetical protein
MIFGPSKDVLFLISVRIEIRDLWSDEKLEREAGIDAFSSLARGATSTTNWMAV